MHRLILAQIEHGLQAVDKAAQQSDRWLFLAAIMLILISAGVTIRYLVKQIDGWQLWMKDVYTENIKLTAQVLVALKENTEMLDKLERHFPDTH